MRAEGFIDMPVSEIMRRWPSTIGVFLDLGMLCVGCPIGVFHTLPEAADEHRLDFETLIAEVSAAIDGDARAGPERVRRRSALAGAGP